MFYKYVSCFILLLSILSSPPLIKPSHAADDQCKRINTSCELVGLHINQRGNCCSGLTCNSGQCVYDPSRVSTRVSYFDDWEVPGSKTANVWSPIIGGQFGNKPKVSQHCPGGLALTGVEVIQSASVDGVYDYGITGFSLRCLDVPFEARKTPVSPDDIQQLPAQHIYDKNIQPSEKMTHTKTRLDCPTNTFVTGVKGRQGGRTIVDNALGLAGSRLEKTLYSCSHNRTTETFGDSSEDLQTADCPKGHVATGIGYSDNRDNCPRDGSLCGAEESRTIARLQLLCTKKSVLKARNDPKALSDDEFRKTNALFDSVCKNGGCETSVWKKAPGTINNQADADKQCPDVAKQHGGAFLTNEWRQFAEGGPFFCRINVPSQSIPSKTATAPTPTKSTVCRDFAFGPNQWKSNAKTAWPEPLIANLCAGMESSTGPAECFHYTVSGQVAWDKEGLKIPKPNRYTIWERKNAVRLCKGSKTGLNTAICFGARIAGTTHNWNDAINFCREGHSKK